jgi:hypothetical protein
MESKKQTEDLIDELRAARMLGVAKSMLARYRRFGGRPAFIQVSRKTVRYAPSDLTKWMDERRSTKKGGE